MPRWVRKGLGQADLTHPTAVGAEIIGTWIYRALMQSYGAWSAAGKVAPPPGGPAAATSARPAE